jgi:hypothetical protein
VAAAVRPRSKNRRRPVIKRGRIERRTVIDRIIKLLTLGRTGGHGRFREINARLRELTYEAEEKACFFCECADARCAGALWMTGREFDALVDNPGCYAVMHEHVDDELDSVVGRNDRYVLVLALRQQGRETGSRSSGSPLPLLS